MIILFVIGLVLLMVILSLKNLSEGVKPHALTLRELLITILCSLCPIILASLINSWFTPVSLIDAFYSSFAMGQVFLFTSAFLSAFFVFYMRGRDKPPMLIFMCFLYSGFGGAFLYTFAYATQVLNLTSHAAPETIKLAEFTIVLSVVIVWYWSTLPSYKKSGSGAKENQNQQSRLESKFANLKGKE